MYYKQTKEDFIYFFDEEAVAYLKGLCWSEKQAKRIYEIIKNEAREEAFDWCVCAGSVYQSGYMITELGIRSAIGNALEMLLKP